MYVETGMAVSYMFSVDNMNTKRFAALLTESSKSTASIARSNKQGSGLYQEWYKPLLISCEAAARL